MKNLKILVKKPFVGVLLGGPGRHMPEGLPRCTTTAFAHLSWASQKSRKAHGSPPLLPNLRPLDWLDVQLINVGK